MNGPEHYREAERILDHAEEHAAAESETWYACAVQAAQAHATLALAAATAETYAEQWSGNHTGREWSEAIS